MKKNIVKIIYTAIVFESTPFFTLFGKRSFERFIGEEYSNMHCHHVTIQSGNINKLPEYLGEWPEFEVHSIRKDQSAIAAFGNVTIGSHALLRALEAERQYITIATSGDIDPVYCKNMVGQVIKEYRWPYVQIYGRCGAFCLFEDATTGWVFEK